MKRAAGIVAAVVIVAAPAQAQDDAPDRRPASAFVSAGLEIAQTRGTFHTYVEAGVGLGADFLWRPNEGPLGLRIGMMWSQYGSTTRRYNLVGLINVDVTTRNQIAGGMIGPQLTLGRGPLQIYGLGGAGFSYFFTRSSVEGSDQNNNPFASTTNYDDATFAWEAGGGLLIRVSRSVAIDLSARYLSNGEVSYVTENSIDFNTNPPTVNAITSDANLIVYRLGAQIALRPGVPKELRPADR